MQIDWITVIAQIVNFLILVWLLHHFLYGPITRAMERREQRIADRLDEAEEKERSAEEEAKRYRRQQRDLEERRDELLDQAREEADDLGTRLREEAREEIEDARTQWRRQLDDERDDFITTLRGEIAARFTTLARRALADLADAELEDQVAVVFGRRVAALADEDKSAIAKAATDDGERVTVRSRFELGGNARRQLTRTVHEEIRDSVDVEYDQDDSSAVGIELTAGSRRVQWTLDTYLDEVEEHIAELLSSHSGSGQDGEHGGDGEDREDGEDA